MKRYAVCERRWLGRPVTPGSARPYVSYPVTGPCDYATAAAAFRAELWLSPGRYAGHDRDLYMTEVPR